VGHVRNAANWRAEHQFLQRSAFVESLDGCLNEASTGRGRLVLVAGEAGVGKSALVQHFREDRCNGARVRCPYEAALALAGADDTDALSHSLAELRRLGARPLAAIVARSLRERGAVSAILSKLDVPSRIQAAAEARRLGMPVG
jgi:AAA ATPase domain